MLMVMLKRSIRLKDQVLLPNGDRVNVNLDVEAHLTELIQAQNGVILAAQELIKDTGNMDLRDKFYAKYRALLQIVLGRGGLERALAAYDGDFGELYSQLDGWIGAELAPRIREASAKRVERRKAAARKTLRRMK